MKNLILLVLLCCASGVVFGQWNNAAFNYTTDRLAIGTSAWSQKRLNVQANEADHIALLENTHSSGYGLMLRAANDPLRIVPFSGSSNYLFVVGGNGNVGIGTSGTSTFKLDVNGVLRSRANMMLSGVEASNGFFADDGAGSTIFSITRQANNETRFQSYGYHTFYSGSSTGIERFRIDGNGNVNIGADLGATTGYGSTLQLLGASSNGDALWLARYNNGNNKSELRINLGDDYGQNEDMFVVGTHHWSGGTWYPHLAVQASGNVGIGTTDTKGYRLAVAGKTITEEVVVKLQSSWPDYVFEEDYNLTSLNDLEQYIKANKHLPDVPSATEVKENGLSVGEMNAILLKKIEELTLHLIDQSKQHQAQQEEIDKLKIKNETLEKIVSGLSKKK